MTLSFAVLFGAICGTGVTYALLRTHLTNIHDERHQQAYEDGWTNGYEVGIRQARPKRPRVKKIQLKAED